MPDFFNTTDNGYVPDGAPRDWSEAFATLPLETPTGDSWPRIVHTLDAGKRRGQRAHREHRTTWLIGLASAAVLVAAAWSPLSHWLQDSSADATSPAVAATATPASRDVVAPAQAASNAAPETGRTVTIDAALASNADRDSKTAVTARARGVRTHAVRKTATHLAAQPPSQTATVPIATDRLATTVPATDAVQSLQAQSARLEALVAIARDERVGNASSELLSAELDASIATVDAALSHDDLDDTHRQQLWQQRVDLLQQLAGVESTARWLAAQGMSNATALVSVD